MVRDMVVDVVVVVDRVNVSPVVEIARQHPALYEIISVAPIPVGKAAVVIRAIVSAVEMVRGRAVAVGEGADRPVAGEIEVFEG